MSDWLTKIVAPIASAAVAGLVVWVAASGRRAASNIGKLTVEEAMQAVDDALREQAEAKKTPDPHDDLVAAEHVRAAKESLKGKKYLAALLSAVGEEPTKE